jgi:hypothetical protein
MECRAVDHINIIRRQLAMMANICDNRHIAPVDSAGTGNLPTQERVFCILSRRIPMDAKCIKSATNRKMFILAEMWSKRKQLISSLGLKANK